MERTGHMNKFKKSCKWILSILLIVIFGCSCNKSYSEINTELTGVLSKQYGIFLSSTVKLVKAEYKEFAERNPYLTVIFDVYDDDDVYSIFDEQKWDYENIESAIKEEIGIDTSVCWIYDAEDLETHYYYGDLSIKKESDNQYRVYFCGYGVNTQYFKN